MSAENFVSLYTPIEVEIEGQKYRIKKLNRARFRALDETEKARQENKDPVAIYDQVKTFLDAPGEVVDEMEIGEVIRLSNYIKENVIDSAVKKATPEAEAEKNAPKPGDEGSPK